MINAALFALERLRRLAVWEQSFNGLRWSDYFASELPPATREMVASAPFDERIAKAKGVGSGDLMTWAHKAVRFQADFRVAALGIKGDLFHAQRSLYQMLCRPTASIEAQACTAMAELGLEPGQFAAVQLRRGDKVRATIKIGRLWSGSENSSTARIAEILDELCPPARDVFVLTDDFAAVSDLQTACRDRRVVTLCPPDADGHDQAMDVADATEATAESVRRLLVDCLIAARSDAFAGGFKSNVAKFVTSIHIDPARCVSTDSQATPWPYP